MESVIKAAVVYLFLLIMFRLSGKRTLYQATPFDLILILIVGHTVQPTLVGEDYSLTNAIIIVTTLILIDILFSFLKSHRKIEEFLDGVPVLIVDNGTILERPLKMTRLDRDDIMESARQVHGIESMDQIKYAILEVNGAITIIPKTQRATT